MMRVRLSVALPMLLMTVLLARGQERGPSHEPIRDWGKGNDIQRARDMAQQLEAAGVGPPPGQIIPPEAIKNLLDLMEQINKRDPKALERAMQDPRFAEKLRDPEFNRQLSGISPQNEELQRQLRERYPRGVKPDQFGDLLNKFKEQAAKRATSGGPNTAGGGIPPGHTPVIPPSNGGQGQTRAIDPPRTSAPERGEQGTATPNERLNEERFREFIKNSNRWLPESLKDSDAVHRFARRFGERDWGQSGDKNIIPERFRPNLDLPDRVRGAGGLFDRTFGRIGRGPRLPNINAPNMPSGPSLPSMPAPGAPSGAEAGGLVTVLMVLGGIIVGAFVIWKLLVLPMRTKQEKPKGWELGNWPVDPARIRTREELIKAFDHLALLNGGKPARHWHHREVADNLGKPDEIRRVSADRLAVVYEHARYAPPQEQLPDVQFDLARRDLMTLAGAGPP
jgi:hypothetical protein